MIISEEYGKLPNGEVAMMYTIVNKHGNRLSLTNYGGRILSLTIKDKIGDYRDVVLGYDDIDGYVSDKHWMGAILGINVGNSVSNGTVQDGITVFVSDNLDQQEKKQDSITLYDELFDCTIMGQENQETIVLQKVVQTPQGRLKVTLSYSFDDLNNLSVQEDLESDINLECNLIQQLYLNLNGQGFIDGHTALINSKYASSTNGGWTASEFLPVEGRVNLNTAKSLKNLGGSKHKAIKSAGGIDLIYQLDIPKDDVGKPFKVGRVRARQSAIKVELTTTKPNVYFYTANRFDNIQGKKNTKISYTQPDNNFDNVNAKKAGVYNKHSGFVLSPATVSNVVPANIPQSNTSVYRFVVR